MLVSVRRSAAGYRLSDLLHTDSDLARHARTVVSAADSGVVDFGMPGTSLVRPQRVLVHDHEGEARIGCEPGGPVDRAATARQWAMLRIEPPAAGAVRLRLIGRLMPEVEVGIDRQQPPGDGVLASVWLSVYRVEVFCPQLPGTQQRQGRSVPLEVYAAAQPDPFLVGAHRLLRHANRHHGLQLRRVAAQFAGVPLADLAAATIGRLDHLGLSLTWIGTAGAHELTVDFPRPADSVSDLIATLRSYFGTTSR